MSCRVTKIVNMYWVVKKKGQRQHLCSFILINSTEIPTVWVIGVHALCRHAPTVKQPSGWCKEVMLVHNAACQYGDAATHHEQHAAELGSGPEEPSQEVAREASDLGPTRFHQQKA